MLDGDPCSIIENEFVKPGKGQAFNRVKIRNLKTGRVIERTFKSGDTSKGGCGGLGYAISLLRRRVLSLMVPDTFEQFTAGAEAVGEAAKWMKGQEVCIVTLYNGHPLSVAPPNFVD